MSRKVKILPLILFVLLLAVSDALSAGFSYWDTNQENRTDTLPIGTWSFVTEVIGLQVATDLSTYADDQIALDPNSPLSSVYQQSGNLNGITSTFENISFYDYVWDVTGFGSAAAVSSIGYVSLIDRIEDGLSTPIHPIVTPYTTTPTYPEYSYFVSYDALNSNTTNPYSLRLNYGVNITTDTPIANLDTVSFYAARGLSSVDDIYAMAVNRTFTVSVSADGVNWTIIGSDTPPIASTASFSYGFYSYNVPVGLQGQNLFLRIEYDGMGMKQGNVKEYSRLVIDELQITTN